MGVLENCKGKELRFVFLKSWTLFHSVFHSTIGAGKLKYILEPDYTPARDDCIHKVREIATQTKVFKMIFFPEKIRELNRLIFSGRCNIERYVLLLVRLMRYYYPL